MNHIKVIFLTLLIAFSTTSLGLRVVEKRDDNLYFVMEKLDANTDLRWWKYGGKGLDVAIHIDSKLKSELISSDATPYDPHKYSIDPDKDEKSNYMGVIWARNKNGYAGLRKEKEIFHGFHDGFYNFREAIRNIAADSITAKSDVWVAYIAHHDPEMVAFDEEPDNVEIAMTVLVKSGFPMVMHMGIARNPFHYLSLKKKMHGRVSVLLHAFAAKVTLDHYPKAKYLITTPLSSMSTLFKEQLPANAYAEGLNAPGTRVNQSYDFTTSKFKFTLKDKNQQDAVVINQYNMEEYRWLFIRLHDPKSFPYFVADLTDLAQMWVKPGMGQEQKEGLIAQDDPYQLLYNAITENSLDRVELLLQQGISANAKSATGESILVWAFYNSKPEIEKLLLKNGADANALTRTGESVFSEVVQIGSPEDIELYLKHGANPNTIKRQSPISFWIIRNARQIEDQHLQKFKILLNYNADPKARDAVGVSLIGQAAQKAGSNTIPLIKLLISQGAIISQDDIKLATTDKVREFLQTEFGKQL